MLPSIWTSIYVELSPEDAARRIAGLGFAAIELSTEHLVMLREAPARTARLAAFRQAVDECGLRMDQAHITITVDICSLDDERRAADQETVLQDIEVLSELGIAAGVLHPGGGGERETWDLAGRQNQLRLEGLARLGAAAERAGVRLALENGCWAFGPGRQVAWEGSVTGLRQIIARIGSPALGICLDTGHAILEGWDNAAAVRTAGDALIALHIADNDGSGDQHRIPYSYGSKVDWPAVVAALREVGYDGPFNLEIPGERGRPLPVMDAAVSYALDVTKKLLESAGARGA